METTEAIRNKIDLKEFILEDLRRLGEKYGVEQIILFGSRAKGTNWERSDIDLAVKGFQSRVDHLDFKEEVEQIRTLLMFDVVDLNSYLIDPCLREEIEKDGVVIYEKV